MDERDVFVTLAEFREIELRRIHAMLNDVFAQIAQSFVANLDEQIAAIDRLARADHADACGGDVLH